MLSILSSIAQGESEDISGNNRWAVEKRFQEGTFVIGTPAYGYKIDENGELVIVEEEAEAVRKIMEYRSRSLKMGGDKYKNRYLFSGRLICEECGGHFRRQKLCIGQPNERVLELPQTYQ